MNPLAFWTRAKAAKSGFESVRLSILSQFDQIQAILSSYGIEMSRELVEQDEVKMKKAANDYRGIMDVLEGKTPTNKPSKLRVISGGRNGNARAAQK